MFKLPAVKNTKTAAVTDAKSTPLMFSPRYSVLKSAAAKDAKTIAAAQTLVAMGSSKIANAVQRTFYGKTNDTSVLGHFVYDPAKRIFTCYFQDEKAANQLRMSIDNKNSKVKEHLPLKGINNKNYGFSIEADPRRLDDFIKRQEEQIFSLDSASADEIAEINNIVPCAIYPH